MNSTMNEDPADPSVHEPRVTDSPAEIWLNYGDIENDCTHKECYTNGDVTWCEDTVFAGDVRYVRADLFEALKGIEDEWARLSQDEGKAERAIEALHKDAERLRADLALVSSSLTDNTNAERAARNAERKDSERLRAAPAAIMDTGAALGLCAPSEVDFPALYALQGRRVALVDLSEINAAYGISGAPSAQPVTQIHATTAASDFSEFLGTVAAMKPVAQPVQPTPSECKTNDEKRAYAVGLFKALEDARNSAQPIQLAQANYSDFDKLASELTDTPEVAAGREYVRSHFADSADAATKPIA